MRLLCSFGLPCVLAGSLVCLPYRLAAQNTANQHMDQGASRMLKLADTTFMLKAAQGGLAEVKMGKLAAEKGATPDVKAFGQQMVDDHTKASDRLKLIAQERRMTLPTDVNQKQQAMYDQLSKLAGPEFDRQFVRSMVADHRKDIKYFQKEAKKGKDEKVKDFASQTLPVLEEHLNKIKDIQSRSSRSSM